MDAVFGTLLTGVGFAWLVGLSQGWAAPAPQVRTPVIPAATSGPGSSPVSQQAQASFSKQTGPVRIKALPRMVNPQAARKAADTAIMAELRTQKQAAEMERSSFMATQRMAPRGQATEAPRLPPGQAMNHSSATGPAAGAMQMAPRGQGTVASRLPPGRTMNNTPAQGQATGALQVPTNNTAIATSMGGAAPRYALGPCLRPTIITVNTQSKGTIFTPDPLGNLYTITGCMFGDQKGQAYIYGSFAAGQLALKIAYWSDKGIVATLDPQITGELDQSNVTLVVVPSGAAPAQKAGFKFYAVRETTRLTKIPVSSVAMGATTPEITMMFAGDVKGYTSPGQSLFPGRTAEVLRDSPHVFSGGQDLFDFSKMRPGFTTESWTLEHTDIAIRDNYQENGTWAAEWVGDNIRVSWQMQHYHYKTLDGVDRDHSESNYGLNVWVSGPKGVGPWPN